MADNRIHFQPFSKGNVKCLNGSIHAIRTTDAKAKTIKPIVEKLITLGKENNLNTRRRLLAALPTKNAVDKVLEVLGPRYKTRKGGYTRIVKIGKRKGDAAEVVQISFV